MQWAVATSSKECLSAEAVDMLHEVADGKPLAAAGLPKVTESGAGEKE